MKDLQINSLRSGGIITNYFCSSRCKHCLYGCSPKWKKEYISYKQAVDNFRTIKKLGCHSVHIGGGEPFLKINSLEQVLKAAEENNVSIEYIETNSSWYKDEFETVNILRNLKMHGLTTLLISMSPFHNEFIPLRKVKGVLNACRSAGVSVFPWIQEFYPELDSMDEDTTHSLEEYMQTYGQKYLEKIPSRYWVHFGGRAIQTFKEVFPLQKLGDITRKAQPCHELANTSHFHIDLFGHYIPGLCSGFAIQAADLGSPLDETRYPIMNMLYKHGIKQFLDDAIKNYEFSPANEYLSKCHLCFEIRRWMIKKAGLHSHELQPDTYYDEVQLTNE